MYDPDTWEMGSKLPISAGRPWWMALEFYKCHVCIVKFLSFVFHTGAITWLDHLFYANYMILTAIYSVTEGFVFLPIDKKRPHGDALLFT